MDIRRRIPPPTTRLYRRTWVSVPLLPRPLCNIDPSNFSVVVALFWLGWTSVPSIHPAVPIMSGFCFGAGYLLIFMAMLNYLTDAYKTFSASVNAAASTTRSLAAVCLPFAAAPMYTRLGIQWACSLLGFVALLMSSVPFVFIFYGKTLRKRSPFCQKLSAASSDTVSFENSTQLSQR